MPRRKPIEEDEEDVEYDEDEPEEFVVDEFVESVFEHPKVRGLFGKLGRALDQFGYLTDQFGQFVGKVSAKARSHPNGSATGSSPPPRRPPPPKPAPKPLNPYLVLGLDPTKPITVDAIKDRRRELAKLFHPDKQGYNPAMQRVNAAADMLLAKLGAK